MKLVIEVFPRYYSKGNIALSSSMGLQNQDERSFQCSDLGDDPLSVVKDYVMEINLLKRLAMAIEKEVKNINQELINSDDSTSS